MTTKAFVQVSVCATVFRDINKGQLSTLCSVLRGCMKCHAHLLSVLKSWLSRTAHILSGLYVLSISSAHKRCRGLAVGDILTSTDPRVGHKLEVTGEKGACSAACYQQAAVLLISVAAQLRPHKWLQRFFAAFWVDGDGQSQLRHFGVGGGFWQTVQRLHIGRWK